MKFGLNKIVILLQFIINIQSETANKCFKMLQNDEKLSPNYLQSSHTLVKFLFVE